MTRSLTERLQLVQGHQRKMLSDLKARQAPAQTPSQEADGANHQAATKPVMDDAERIDPGLFFERLLEPITTHMGCTPQDIEWIRQNWSSGEDLLWVVQEWAAKVVLEGVAVDEELRSAAAMLHKRGPACLRAATVEQPVKAAEATNSNTQAPQAKRGAMRP